MAALPEYEPLRVYVDATSEEDVAKVAEDWPRAVEAVTKIVTDGGKELADIPAATLQGAIVDVGAELYARRDAPFGVTTFATGDGAVAARVSADATVRAKAALADYLEAGFA